jgi:hypothetical protein
MNLIVTIRRSLPEGIMDAEGFCHIVLSAWAGCGTCEEWRRIRWNERG